MSSYRWEVGTLYASRQEFKDIVLAYAVHTGRSIKFKKCDMVRVRAVCQKDCQFWLYAHRVGDESTWQLRSMNLQHTCMQTHRVGILHTKWLGAQFKKKVESNPKIKIKELQAKAHKKWNVTVTKSMAAKSKQEALSQIQGAFREQYKRINDYCAELLRANPGSSVSLKVIRSPDFAQEVQNPELMNYCVFQRLYVCFNACKKSFQHCRPFISLDGCFLKTPQGGQLLTAIGRDPNDHILPIAYAVVKVETKDSWGLLPAFEEVIPGIDNRYCVRCLYNNFRKKFPGLEMKNQMWRCAKSTHWKDWEKEMKSLRLKNEVEAREKPIVTMLEDIKVYVMTRWAANRDRIQLYQGNITPTIRKELEKRAKYARDWRSFWSTASKYEVMCGLDKFIVDLSAGEYSCRRWQMSGLPYPYAISCITFKGLDMESFVDDHYKKDAYLMCYQEVQPATQQVGKGPKRGMKVASSQPPGQTVQRGKLSRTLCSQPNPTTTQPKKPATRPRKSAAKPTDHSTQPKNQAKKSGPALPQSNPKAPSTQPLP
ncbi:uncharacterized protein [Arachis hypogaea]|uniref:uncharacterized protein n=1 Tax=Arachis hypogaea TaxID=3818 RepID=UPI000DEDA774|nr:uncharacterized protein LOC112779015 [Arachis hypogaea]